MKRSVLICDVFFRLEIVKKSQRMPAFKKFTTYAPAGKFEGEPTYKRKLYRITLSIILFQIFKTVWWDD